MAQGVREGFPCGQRRVQRFVDALDAAAARLQRDDGGEPPMAHTEESPGEPQAFTEIIQSLQASLRPLAPDQAFAERLRFDLLDGAPGYVGRLRQMPGRLSVAAILAVIAGFVLFMLRRLFGSEASQEMQEEAVATPL